MYQLNVKLRLVFFWDDDIVEYADISYIVIRRKKLRIAIGILYDHIESTITCENTSTTYKVL